MFKYIFLLLLLFPTYIIYHFLRRFFNSYRRKKDFLIWVNAYPKKQIRELLAEVYDTTDGWELAKQALKKRGWEDHRFTYGEITLISFMALFEKTMPTKEDVFYDLGCGVGKTVLIAALLYDIKAAVGVEYFPEIHEECEKTLARLPDSPLYKRYFANKKLDITFKQADLLGVDINAATIVFINATCFIGEQWEAIEKKLMTLPPGSRLILVTRRLDSPDFQLNYQGLWPMSWGRATVRIYTRVI